MHTTHICSLHSSSSWKGDFYFYNKKSLHERESGGCTLCVAMDTTLASLLFPASEIEFLEMQQHLRDSQKFVSSQGRTKDRVKVARKDFFCFFYISPFISCVRRDDAEGIMNQEESIFDDDDDARHKSSADDVQVSLSLSLNHSTEKRAFGQWFKHVDSFTLSLSGAVDFQSQ